MRERDGSKNYPKVISVGMRKWKVLFLIAMKKAGREGDGEGEGVKMMKSTGFALLRLS